MNTEICSKFQNCQGCDLYKSRRSVIIGSGNPNASILIVKEMPSQVDDKYGTFFTDSLNFLLDVYFQTVLSKRGKFTKKEAREIFADEVFVTSAVSCRGVINAGDNAGNNREPKQSEIKACRDRLHEVVYSVDPDIVLACGKPAVIGLTKKNKDLPQKIGTLESLFTFDIPGVLTPTIKYSGIYTHDISHAEKVGDYDDPNGVIAQLSTAVMNVWKISEAIKGERL
jgi:uracil-DNA glycosylase family 4